jgi:squalene-hopene/tetraprenyl-beta-curcumene cyclase
VVTAKRAIRRLLIVEEDHAYCQPCLSPVWDTALASHAMLEVADRDDSVPARRALDWLVERQITEFAGDWTVRAAPGTRPGGWAFEYWNDHYPDVDDTAAVVCAMHRADPDRYKDAIDRAVEWILGMQSTNGGWGAFDVDNTHYYLNSIPFADHGALLDPPTADVTARCLSMLAQTGHGPDHPAVARAVAYLRDEQEENGAWFGRWGTNYVYGTWSVLVALNAAGEDMGSPHIQRAVDWLTSKQREDGGWGESCATYWDERKDETVESLPSQTAWALLALMAAGETESDVVKRGVDYLRLAERQGGAWEERLYNAVGFPKVFYLHYHGYRTYFPLWALARYANLMNRNDRRVSYGM